MFRFRSMKRVNNMARVKAVIRRDRAAIRTQRQLDVKKKDGSNNEINDIWDYSLFRRVVGERKKDLHNWFWE